MLVQPLIEPAYGGVMFGIDPVTGRTDRRVVSAVRGAPEQLVSGEVDGSRYLLDPTNAKVLEFDANDGPQLEPADLRRLVELSAKVASVYGGAAGRRVGDRHGQAAVAAAVAPGHHRDPRRSARTDLRPGPGRRDLPVAAHGARARPLGPPAPRSGARSGGAGRLGHRGRGGRQRVVVCVDGHVAIDLRLAGEIKTEDRACSAS